MNLGELIRELGTTEDDSPVVPLTFGRVQDMIGLIYETTGDVHEDGDEIVFEACESPDTEADSRYRKSSELYVKLFERFPELDHVQVLWPERSSILTQDSWDKNPDYIELPSQRVPGITTRQVPVSYDVHGRIIVFGRVRGGKTP